MKISPMISNFNNCQKCAVILSKINSILIMFFPRFVNENPRSSAKFYCKMIESYAQKKEFVNGLNFNWF